MALNLKWSQHFQSNLSDFENKYAMAQTHLSPLGFALNQKIISVENYLKWAQATYHLPIIADDYFNAYLPSIEDWKSWKSEYQWNEEIVPIGLWDGHLLVACLEIPSRFPASLYPIFLLADFKNTQRTYQFYINSDKGSESVRKLKDLIHQPDDSKKIFEPIELSDNSDFEEEDAAEELIINQGEPEGLSLHTEPNPTKSFNQKDKEISFDNLDALSTPSKEEISLKFSNVEINSSVSLQSNKNSHPETNSGLTSSKHELTMNTTLSAQLPDSIQNEINKGLPYFIAIKKDNPSSFENLTQSYFAKVSNLFDKFILIAVDPSELHAVPVSWSDNITPRSKDLEKLDLTEPSIFKTVATTFKSYHGYIVLNENNEKFFEFWNQGQVPGNVTMVPLVIRNKLVGMWMGLGESNTCNWNTLKQMESKSRDMCESFANMFKETAKAS